MQRKNKKHIWQYAIRKDVNYFENVIPMIVYFSLHSSNRSLPLHDLENPNKDVGVAQGTTYIGSWIDRLISQSRHTAWINNSTWLNTEEYNTKCQTATSLWLVYE